MKTIPENILSLLAAVISACVVFVSGYLYYVSPERRWPYLLAIAVVCGAWTARGLFRGDGDSKSQAVRRKLTYSIISAGLMLGVALGGALMARLGWMVGFAL